MSQQNQDGIWKHIIEYNNINLKSSFPIITSTQIKDSKSTWLGKKSQFEPRILCKMDFSKNRPKIFSDNNISIIAIRKDVWLFTKDNIYISLPSYSTCPKLVNRISKSILLDYTNPSSEGALLDILDSNHIFSMIVGEEIIAKLNCNRRFCHFQTILNDTEVTMNTQFEIDAYYESENCICIVEAKININCKDFNLRQLYVPYMELSNKMKTKNKYKTIIPLFLYKDKNQIIHIHQFKWMDETKISNVRETAYFQYII